ncbi:hypothetical protein XELAEV_18040172mg [Xenopus laevis]|uniref:G-protein coupled receptors family 1 profile domain-containing protein n=1 Tax=Xenopus laevis TaxID=8355 RepID=A0A974H914_XENLA|nr:hypothetical protein XELAEV_18040172mg [Xenopus laevis]
MCENNSGVTEFLMLGFQGSYNFKIMIFTIFLVIYAVILTGNLLIILLTSTSKNLNFPMYSFLKHLALVDILFTSNILPKLLHVTFTEGGLIHKNACFFQYYIHSISIYSQSLVITVMSFDRYLAICHPLRYSSIMNQKLCFYLIFWSWATGFFLIPTLSSSNTAIVKWDDFTLSILLLFLPCLFVLLSYLYIFITIAKISSFAGKKKAFSTCSSHLATVCTYYGSIITVYIFTDGKRALQENKLRSLIYTVLTPLFNPIMYSLRNREIQNALKDLISKKKRRNNTSRR